MIRRQHRSVTDYNDYETYILDTMMYAQRRMIVNVFFAIIPLLTIFSMYPMSMGYKTPALSLVNDLYPHLSQQAKHYQFRIEQPFDVLKHLAKLNTMDFPIRSIAHPIEQQVVRIFDTAPNRDVIIKEFNKLIDDVCRKAIECRYRVPLGILSQVKASVAVLRQSIVPEELAFHIGVINHLLSDVDDQIVIHFTKKPILPDKSVLPLIKVISEVVSLPEADIYKLLTRAGFICDMTLGKRYLPSSEYGARLDFVWKVETTLSAEQNQPCTDVSAKLLVDAARACQADVAAGKGLSRAVEYLEHVDAVRVFEEQKASSANVSLNAAQDLPLDEVKSLEKSPEQISNKAYVESLNIQETVQASTNNVELEGPLTYDKEFVPLEVQQETISALETSHSQQDLVTKMADIADGVTSNACHVQEPLSPESKQLIFNSLQEIERNTDPVVIATNVVKVNTLLTGLQDKLVSKHTPKGSLAQRSVQGLGRALGKFFENIGQTIHLQENLELLAGAITFACDAALGSLYMSKEACAARIESFWHSLDVLSPEKFAYLMSSDGIQTIGKCAAFLARSTGLRGTRKYLKHLDKASSGTGHVAQIAQSLKNSLDMLLKTHPMLLTAQGGVILSTVAGIAVIKQTIESVRTVFDSVDKLKECYELNEGLFGHTQIKTVQGYKAINDLKVGDKVTGIDASGKPYERPVLAIRPKVIPEYIKLHIGDQVIHAAPEQKFYLPAQDRWIAAQSIEPGYNLSQGHAVTFTVDHVEWVHDIAKIYRITVQDHEFCITLHDIDVHNADPVTLSVVAMGIIEPLLVSAGGAIAGVATKIFWDTTVQHDLPPSDRDKMLVTSVTNPETAGSSLNTQTPQKVVPSQLVSWAPSCQAPTFEHTHNQLALQVVGTASPTVSNVPTAPASVSDSSSSGCRPVPHISVGAVNNDSNTARSGSGELLARRPEQVSYTMTAQEQAQHEQRLAVEKSIEETLQNPALVPSKSLYSIKQPIEFIKNSLKESLYTQNLVDLRKTCERSYSYFFGNSLLKKEINLITSTLNGTVSQILNTVETGTYEEAMHAYAWLKENWPWDHELQGFATRTLTGDELTLVRALGIDIMKMAERSMLSRHECLLKNGCLPEEVGRWPQLLPTQVGPVRYFDQLHKSGSLRGLQASKEFVLAEMKSLSPFQYPDRLLKQAQLVKLDILIEDLVAKNSAQSVAKENIQIATEKGSQVEELSTQLEEVVLATEIPLIEENRKESIAKAAAKMAAQQKANNNASMSPLKPEDPEKNKKNNKSTPEVKEFKNGKYKDAPYHTKNGNAIKSPRPKNGQKALDNSFPIKETSKRRIGISEGEFVVLDETSPGLYHGHVRTWQELKDTIQNILIDNGLVRDNGKIIK